MPLQDDLARRAYKMKQAALADRLVDAAGLGKGNPDAKRAVNWSAAAQFVGLRAGTACACWDGVVMCMLCVVLPCLVQEGGGLAQRRQLSRGGRPGNSGGE
jgi:hypothetical protein